MNTAKQARKRMVSQRWDPDLQRRVKEASSDLGQSVSTFTERAIEAYLQIVEEQRRAASAQKPKLRKRVKSD